MAKWHSLSLNAVFSQLQSSDRGLTEKQAADRFARHGPNSLKEAKKAPWYALLFSQFKSLPILMLIAAALISLALGLTMDDKKLIDAIAITAAILIAVFFGFWQEYKAERALEALKRMVVQRSVVLRGGKEVSVDSSQLVPGDVIILEEGSRVPADIRLFEATSLAADQSALTGESYPSRKVVRTLPAKAVLSEQSNMIFAGTILVRGHCKGIVVETAMGTEFGKIVGIVGQEEDKETRLQQNLSELSKKLGYAGIALAAAFFAIGAARGSPLTDMFVVAVTLAVAVIPEGLPTVLAITLAIGVQKMARKNAIVRRMSAVETLGSATVICTDKTGTLTQNRMTVTRLALAETQYDCEDGADRAAPRRDSVLRRALEVMALCNNAMKVSTPEGERLSGDPTETALLLSAEQWGIDERRLRADHRQMGEVPFDSERKMMSSIRLFGNKRLALVKGAPEKILPRCKGVLVSSGERPLAPARRQEMLSNAHSLAGEGMRVLALAYRPIGAMKEYSSQNTERGLIFVGLAGMEDPPRQEVAESISLCHSAGIRVIMVTGDSAHTARAIASRIGLLSEGQLVIDGPDLEAMDDAALLAVLPRTGVFARTTPGQKHRIVQALMGMGEVVAVTGDGVNDAPAIKKADIGVAMGVSGTDVTKEVAEIVLTDDNFASIVNAVKYGRTIFNNIKSFVRYQLSTNVAALSLMFSAPALSLPLPLLPLQILWINIMIDGPPALALGAELPASDIMQRPPRDPKQSFITRNLVLSILVLGLAMAGIALAVFAFYLSSEPEKACTAVFTLFVFLQLFNALNCRSASKSAFARFFSNKALFVAIVASLALHMAIVYFAPLQEIFKTVPLSAGDLILLAAAALLIIALEEFKKAFLPRTTVY